MDDAKASKLGGAAGSGQTSVQGSKTDNSTSQQTNDKRAQRPSRTPSSTHENATKGQGSAATAQLPAELEASEEILALQNQIKNVQVVLPSLPVMSNQFVDSIRDQLSSADATFASVELPLLEHTETAISKFDALSEYDALFATY